jgi:gamma-glutamylcyclotransferase (GGCT)/AIG2-like uncharacterized protein YtfP
VTHLIFAYGTLLNPAVQETVIGRQIAGKRDRLSGYRKATLQDGAESYPNLVPDENSRVDGHIIEVTQEELGRIDLYEAGLYSRHKVTVESGTEAWVYFA